MRSSLIESTYRAAKSVLEKWLGITVYRSNTPWGLSMFNDIRRLNPTFAPKIIFDVGANIGEVSLRLSQGFPEAQIYAFEPVPSTFSLLQRNTCIHQRIKPMQIAIGDSCGTVKMMSMANSVLSRVVTPSDLPADASMGTCIDVEVKTIDRVASDLCVDRIDLLKSDTEGFELRVLRGAEGLLRSGAIEFLLVEAAFPPTVHNDKVENSTLAEFLEPFGFRCVGIYDQEYWTRLRLHYGNVLFYKDCL